MKLGEGHRSCRERICSTRHNYDSLALATFGEQLVMPEGCKWVAGIMDCEGWRNCDVQKGANSIFPALVQHSTSYYSDHRSQLHIQQSGT